MMLAEAILVWVGIVFAIGFLGFFVVLLGLAFRLLRYVFRVLARKPARGMDSVVPVIGRRVTCSQPRCGHANRAGAKYCSRCGAPLAAALHAEYQG
jgi:hypothetical protein